MNDCGHSRSELLVLLGGDLAPERRRILLDRVDACRACADELRSLRRTWDELPAASTGEPPAGRRGEVLAYAERAVRERRIPARVPWRAALLGGLASLGGYLILSLLHPIPSTVEFCQLRIFRDPAMSLGQVCLIYAAVAALYAGLPVAVAAYLSPVDGDGWRLGLAEGAAFTLLALPVLGLQFGLDDAVITATVVGGLAVGAAAGGITGSLAAGSRRGAGARA